jgi:hypothetical protein
MAGTHWTCPPTVGKQNALLFSTDERHMKVVTQISHVITPVAADDMQD